MRKLRVCVQCLGAAMLTLAQHPASADQTAPPPPAAPDNIATFTDDAERLRVDVSIEATPLHFLVDTASTRSVVSAEVAARLNLPSGPMVNVRNIGGSDRVNSVKIPELRFSALTIQNVVAPALLQRNLGGDGLVGLDILHGQRLTIRFKPTNQISITPSERGAHTDQPPIEPGTIVVTARSKRGELILTDAEIEGEQVSVVIDTGSEDSVGNEPLRQLVRRQLTHATLRPVTLLSVTGRMVSGEFTQIGHVKIGGLQINNLPIAFSEISSFQQFGLSKRPAILLGMTALRLFDTVTLDFTRRQIWFRLDPAQKT